MVLRKIILKKVVKNQKVQDLVDKLWQENPQLYEMLRSCYNVESARKSMYKYLHNIMRQLNHEDLKIPRLGTSPC